MHTPTLTLTMAGEVGIWNYTGLVTLAFFLGVLILQPPFNLLNLTRHRIEFIWAWHSPDFALHCIILAGGGLGSGSLH